jgi:hypothetical protein
MHDMIWAAAFAQAVLTCAADEVDTRKIHIKATEYANEVLRVYAKAIASGLPVRS